MRLLRNKIVVLSYLESRQFDRLKAGVWYQKLPVTRNFQDSRIGFAYFATISIWIKRQYTVCNQVTKFRILFYLKKHPIYYTSVDGRRHSGQKTW